MRRPLRLDGALHELGQRGWTPLQHDLARGDPRHVEQVVDEPHHQRDLALDHGPHSPHGLRGVAGEADQLESGADRRQWIAQLVRQEREELVLARVGFAQLTLGSAIVSSASRRRRDQLELRGHARQQFAAR